MQLIIQVENKKVYAYLESDKHFKQADAYRHHLERLPASALDKECNLANWGDNFYIVVPVAPRVRQEAKRKEQLTT